MKPTTLNGYRVILTIIAASILTAFAGCGDYKVSITEQPTRKIDQRLLGTWVSRDGAELIKVRPLDDSFYIISYSGVLFRAFHSDVGGLQFINAQDLETTWRNYFYLSYRLSSDGSRLYVRVVSDKVIPPTTRDSASVQKLLKDNLQNPSLFGSEGEFLKQHE